MQATEILAQLSPGYRELYVEAVTRAEQVEDTEALEETEWLGRTLLSNQRAEGEGLMGFGEALALVGEEYRDDRTADDVVADHAKYGVEDIDGEEVDFRVSYEEAERILIRGRLAHRVVQHINDLSHTRLNYLLSVMDDRA